MRLFMTARVSFYRNFCGMKTTDLTDFCWLSTINSYLPFKLSSHFDFAVTLFLSCLVVATQAGNHCLQFGFVIRGMSAYGLPNLGMPKVALRMLLNLKLYFSISLCLRTLLIVFLRSRRQVHHKYVYNFFRPPFEWPTQTNIEFNSPPSFDDLPMSSS